MAATIGINEVRKPVVSPPVPPLDPHQTLELRGHVGFSSLPDQLVQKAIQNGFTFNLLCVGETGIGKSTLMESLFNMKFDFKPCNYDMKSVELNTQIFDVEEGGVRLKLTIVETAGFGDQLDKENSVKVISEFINKQYELYLQEEMQMKRCLQLYKDTRIHACLYFVSPTGHGLKALDVVALKDLCKKVNIIPIIAKADTISKDELQRFKNKILSELKSNNIEYYKFPEDDETMRESNVQLNKSVPFAVVGSVDFVKIGNKNIRARQYPWGIVEVENEEHCDFVKLREALLRLNVEDLRERTHRVLYEFYRRHRLHEMGLKDGDLGPGLKQIYDQRRAEHLTSVRSKEESLKAYFVQRVKDKESELQEKEKDLSIRRHRADQEHNMSMQMFRDDEQRFANELADFERQRQKVLEEIAKRNDKKQKHK